MAKLNCRAQSKPDKLSPKTNFKRHVVSARLDNKELIYEPETYCLELEKQLAAMEYSWQELYEFAPIGYLDLDKDHCILKANLTSTQLFQIPRSRLIGKRLPTLVSKNSQPVLHLCLQQVSAENIKQSYELELLRNDGSSFYSQVECTVIIDPVSKLTLLRLAIIDIGERRLAKQILKCSEEKFRSIVEATKEWIWTIDLKGRYLYSNPAVTDILGYSVTELLGYNRLWLIHKEDLPVIVKMLPLSTRGKRGWNLTLRWRCKDGSYRYLESSAVPFFDTKGTLLGFRGTERDVTLRKQVEEQTRQQQAVVHQASKINSLGELASTLAHELAQPLTAINNFITGCIRRLNSNTNQKKALLEALQQAAEQAERAGQIIHRMKNFVRYGKIQCEKVDINNIIDESIALIKKEFPSSIVKIYFQPLKPRILITADKIQLEQVMLNLMRNSIEIMRDYAVLDPQLQIECTSYSNQHILIKVSDNGPGFCFDGDLDKLFEACFTTKVDGLGIGLAISRTIIEAHGGHLRAYRRNPEKGACFQITLPVNQGQNDKS
jgi:PAS domain S-box-containing protein